MLINRAIKKDVIVFSRWSRKNYAIFASLKRVVNIGCLTIDLCKTALLKSPSALLLIKLTGFEEDEISDIKDNETVENLAFFATALPAFCSINDIYHQIENNNYTIRKPIFCHEQSMGFLF